MVRAFVRRFPLPLFFLLIGLQPLSAQTFDFERQNVGRYVQRMYENTNAEGVQRIDTGNNHYIVAILSLNEAAYHNASAMNRVAQVKANSMISKYLNGSRITTESITHLVFDSDSLIVSGTSTEQITEVSIGTVKAIELFYSFKSEDGRIVYVFGGEVARTKKHTI